MDDINEDRKPVRKSNHQDIVPVHVASSALKIPISESPHKENSANMKVKDGTSEETLTTDETDDGVLSPWLWGGPIGSNKTVLVFRSCVLASKDKTSQDTTPLSPGSSFGRNAVLFNKSLHMASVSQGPSNNHHSSSSRFQEESEQFGAACSDWEEKIFGKVDKGVDFNGATASEQMESHDIKRKRDIRDVLNDINKITLKKKLINNSTAIIPKIEKCVTLSEEKDIGKIKNKSLKTKFISTIPSIHKVKKKTNSKVKRLARPSSLKKVSPDKDNVSFDSENSESSDLDYKNIDVPERKEMPASILHLTYKTAMTETKLLSRLLHAHGFTDVHAHSKDFSLLWTGLHPKPDLLRSLRAHQRVNHFPRSYELTRKDKLYKNIEKMQYFRGSKNFDFIPITFLMPVEFKELCTSHYRTKGPWIVKPAASSRGRGIYIVDSPDQIPKGESVVVAKYIDKPLLVDGHKCDLRLYVCVTSFDPLLIYMYEEGLVRFATVKYDKSNKNLWNPCMHLCNYSINKYHSDYIKCEDPSAENVGHKWTLSALLRHLRREGRDTGALMAAIEDVVVKSMLSCTQSITTASRMFVPHFSNCFELYGFDILIDETLKPWLLEINLSPSLGCDSPLDARLKSSLLADTLTLIGIPAVDPTERCESSKSAPQPVKSVGIKMRLGTNRRVHSADLQSSSKKSFGSTSSNSSSLMTKEEARIVKIVKAQYQRRGGFVRIFPSRDSWQKYAQYLDPITGVPVCSTSVTNATNPHSLIPHNYNLLVHSHVLPDFDQNVVSTCGKNPPERLKRYERVLPVCMRVSLESANGASAASTSRSPYNSFAIKNGPHDAKTAKMHIKQQLQGGKHLTLGESRRAFGMFLNCVLKRISNSTSEQSAHHAELISRFLKRATNSLKLQYNVKTPSHKMSDKDKAAVVAKQLSDFLYIYHRDTDMYTNSIDQRDCISNIHFAQFMYSASETDLEDILLTVLKKEGNVAPFLGDRLSPLCVDIPPPQANSTVARQAPRTHQLLRFLAHVTPVHSRRYRPPSPEVTSLPYLSQGSTSYCREENNSTLSKFSPVNLHF